MMRQDSQEHQKEKKQCLILIQSFVAVRQIQYWNFANLK